MQNTSNYGILCAQCVVLHDLIPFVQFKKREKHPGSSVAFSKVAGNLVPFVQF